MDQSFDEIHRIYIRMSEISDALLSHPDFATVALRSAAGELLGLSNAVGQEAARLKVFTTKLMTSDPDLYRVWQDALHKTPQSGLT